MTMRVPTKLVFETRRDEIMKNQAEILELQRRISSGLRVLRPSDSPSEYSVSRSIEVRISKLSRDISDSNEALHFLKASEEVLSKLSDVLSKARLHAERGLGSSTNEEFGALASAVEELFRQAVDLANTSVKGRFIFGGSRTTSINSSYRKPYYDNEVTRQQRWESKKGIAGEIGEALGIKEGRFNLIVHDPYGNDVLKTEVVYTDKDTMDDLASKINTVGGGLVLASSSPDGRLTVFSTTPGYTFSVVEDNMGLVSEIGGDDIPEYHGDEKNLDIEIQSSLISITFDGREIFGDAGRGIPGVLTVLRDLVDVLRFRKEGNTQELLRASVLEIERMQEVVSSVRARVGERISFVEKRLDLANLAKVEETVRKSEIEDIDMAQVAVELSLKESVLRASMLSAVRSFELTLLRYL